MANVDQSPANEDEQNALEILASLAQSQPPGSLLHQRGARGPGRSPGSAIKSSVANLQRSSLRADDTYAPQKWVQCAKCEQWRKVPYALSDDDIPDDWECSDNVWDQPRRSCQVPQALTDKQIDEILANQAKQEHGGFLHASPMELGDDDLDTRRGTTPQGESESPAIGGKNRGRSAFAHEGRGAASRAGRMVGGRGGTVKRGAAGGRSRPPATNAGRGRARGMKGMNEAAEALLGMGSHDIDDAEQEPGDEGAAESEPPGVKRTSSSVKYPPGTAVWAKVEGHDWWPAKVVRRRAVPREVGPPPGGPHFVRQHIPVVFFTANGIPSERHGGETPAGLRAGDVEEAEYAWLLSDCMKPFKPGDSVPFVGSAVSEDVNLQACIEAAGQAVAESDRKAQARAAAMGSSDPHAYFTDSDGGWGVPALPPEATLVTRPRGGKGRGRGGRRGRGKGTRRGGRGTRRGREDDLEDSDSDGNGAAVEIAADPAATPASVSKIVVEQIWAWRWPLSNAEKAAEKAQENAAQAKGEQTLKSLQDKDQAAPAPDCAPAQAAADEKAKESALVSELHERLAPSGPQPSPHIPNDMPDALLGLFKASNTQAGNSPENDNKDMEPEYLVKYSGRAHIHDEWVSESLLMKIAKRKCINFKRRYGEPCNLIESEWMVPERFVARRCAPAGPGWEVLVKWKGQNYENCTWEMEGEGMLVKPQYLELHKQLWKRQKEAVRKASTEAEAEAKAALVKARKYALDIQDRPPYITDKATLYPHQLQAINWLRKLYLKSQSSILADEAGLGKTASVVVFMQALRHEIKINRPILIIVPQASLAFWEGELEFWAGEDCNVISYAGSNSARSIIHDHELWLQHGSLDERTSYNASQTAPSKVVKADVVLAAHEAVGSDNGLLSAISWNLIVVDERKRVRSALAKAFASVKSLDCQYRLLLSQTDLSTANPTILLQCLSFLKPEIQEPADVAKGFEGLPEDQQVAKLTEHLKPLTMRRMQAEIVSRVPSKVEIQIPVAFTSDQAEFYKQILSKFYDVLVDPKTHRLSSSRASQSKIICDELRKVVSHPFVVPELAPEKDTAADSLAASGKLPVLEKMMKNLQATGRRALLLSHDASVLEILEEHFADQFGKESVERIDDSTPSAERHECVQRFNKTDGKAFLFMQTVGCCGLGTNLPNVAVVLVHDSDWNPRADIQAVNRCHKVGSRQPGIPTLRLFVTGSVEEKLMLMCENVAGMEAVYAASGGNSRSLGSSAPLMEEILRWGTQDLFQPRNDLEDAKKAVQSDTASDPPGQVEDSSTLRPDNNQAASLLAFEDEAINQLMEKAIQNGQMLEETTESIDHGQLFGPDLERITVRSWKDSKDVAEQDEEDGEDFNEEEAADEEDGQEMDTTEPMLGATYWANLLGNYAGNLKGAQEGLDRKPSRKRNRTEKAAAAFADSSDHNSDAEDGEEVNTQNLDFGRNLYNPGDALDTIGNEEPGRRGSGRGARGGRNGGRGTRGARRRRGEADDDDASDMFDARDKRRKKAQDVPGYSPQTDQLLDELARHDVTMLALLDPTSPEGKILQRASGSLEDIINEAELEPEALAFAIEAARVLLITSHESEPPAADFLNHTLLALAAVGSHLASARPNSKASLHLLVQRFNIGRQTGHQVDYGSVKKVFEHILAALQKYRMFFKSVTAMKEGRLEIGNSPARQGGEYGHQGRSTDLDAFGSKLTAIVASDFSDEAMQSPLDLAQFPTPFMGPEIERANPQLAKEFELVQDQLRELTTQIAMKDRIHNIRVKHIQEEYQSYMERVRSKAQSGIDMANTLFQTERQELTAQVDMLVHLIHSRYLHVLGHVGNSVNQGGSAHNGDVEVEQRVPAQRPAEVGPSSHAHQFEGGRPATQDTQARPHEDTDARFAAQLNGGNAMNQLSRVLQAKQAQAFPMSNDGRSSNGGLASMAVQSAQGIQFQQQQQGGQRPVGQESTLPLQRLTSEQIADVQQQISSTPNQQSPQLPSNPASIGPSYDMTMFPSFFQNPTQKAEQENSQRIQHIQQEYVSMMNAQKQMGQRPMPSSAFDTSRVQMEDHTNSAQASISTHTPFFNGRPMQTAIARPPGPEDPGARNWEKRSQSSHSTPSRSPSPTREPQQPAQRPQLPLLAGKPIMQAHGQRVQDGPTGLRQDHGIRDTGIHQEDLAHPRQVVQAGPQGAALSGMHFGPPSSSQVMDFHHAHAFQNPPTLQGYNLAANQRALHPTGEPGRDHTLAAAVQRGAWPKGMPQTRMGQEGPMILSSQTVTSGAGTVGLMNSGIGSIDQGFGRPLQQHDRLAEHPKHSNQEEFARPLQQPDRLAEQTKNGTQE